MKKINTIISPKYTSKIKSFLISDGVSKIILARQFIPISKIELMSFHSRLILHLTSTSSSLTSFTSNNSFYLYKPFSIDEQSKLYFVLITDVNFNPIEANEIIKPIYLYVTSLITSQNGNNNALPIIKQNAYDIILSIDDVINPFFGSERTSQSKLIQNLKMVSNEAEYERAKKEEKIQKAHDNLVKGMEEIERLKYQNKYIPNAISSEDINAEAEDLKESQKIIEEIEEEKAKRERISNISSGLNLHRHFLGRLHSISDEDRERMSSFVNACENIVQAMMLREIHRMENGEDEDDEEEGTTTLQFIVPVGVFYTNEDE